MRVMISVSLPSELIARVSAAMSPDSNRSAVVAEALEEWLQRRERKQAPEVEPQKTRR